MKSNNTNFHIKVLSVSTSIIAIFIIINLFTGSTNPVINDTNKDIENAPNFKTDYSIFSIKIPDNITFANEKVPL